MKILHVITSLKMGGAEMLVVNLVPRFRAMGHEVAVVAFNGERTVLMERLERECPDCKIYRFGNSFYNPLYILKLVRIMLKYDIVHTHNSSPQLFAAIANLFCHKRLVTTEHNTSNRKRGNPVLAKIDKWMYPRYEKVICISDQAEDNLRLHLYGSENHRTDNICTVYNGVEVEAIHTAKPIGSIKPEKFVVVMVAAFRPQKDQDTLVRAMARLPKEEYEVWLVGEGERKEEVESFVKALGVSENVKFWGVRTDVPNILKTADVVVMSTHYEGLSLSNIEGMAAAKPFVASDVEGIHEVTDGYGILVPHEDADRLAEAIRQLHDDGVFYKQVADRCYERARQFDISVMASNYNAIYMSAKQ